MLSQSIRRQFLDYFKKYHHTIVPSSPVVPHDDPTLLFINAGMNQFKDVFLGKSVRDYQRAASSQKCIRVGGKHNDLENVGHTSRHLTFFEMLGNFSFGDYFKKEAIQFAWEVSTSVFGFDPNRIWPTVYKDDDEAFELWTQYVPAERITRFGEKENFWMMGETGPCGPCSELLYDRGPSFGSATKPIEDPTGERFLEYWNLVFMQYNRSLSGQAEPLPKPSIDTGAGLERVVNLKMGVNSVFETDILRSIIAQTEIVSGKTYHADDPHSSAFRVIADHLRCLSFAIADGVQPSNVDRGYVLRKVLRRAVRYGRQLGLDKPFLADILPQLVSTMGGDYPELVASQDRIGQILTGEEEAFIRTLKRGGNILNQVIEKAQIGRRISGDDAFKLKDTYGLPFEEILLIAKDSELEVDQGRFNQLEDEARQRSRQVHKSVHQVAEENIFAPFVQEKGETVFTGYEGVEGESHVVGLVLDGKLVEILNEGEEGFVLLSATPFYPEMGGQVGDTGELRGAHAVFAVSDTVVPYKGVIAHVGKVTKGPIHLGDDLSAVVDVEKRKLIARNHTATHLLHWALQRVLGEHIKQAGSVVDAKRLRFDFSHHKPLTIAELRQIEDLINEKIRENTAVKTYELKYEEAQKRTDIKQFFGEKYGSEVRVVDIDFSKELCGGTHTDAVGTIGLFKIAKESSIAAGIRRIEAVTGREAEQEIRENEDLLLQLGALFKAPQGQIKERVEKLMEENKQALQSLKEFKEESLKRMIDEWIVKAEEINGSSTLITVVPVAIDELKLAADLAMERTKCEIIVLAALFPDKCQVVARVSEAAVKRGVSAHVIIQSMMKVLEGSGGGKPAQAQGGGKAVEKLEEAFAAAKNILKQQS